MGRLTVTVLSCAGILGGGGVGLEAVIEQWLAWIQIRKGIYGGVIWWRQLTTYMIDLGSSIWVEVGLRLGKAPATTVSWPITRLFIINLYISAIKSTRKMLEHRRA
jgi:hypothetical protein